MASISRRSDPKILTPTGVRTPVLSMSMRFLMGMVQALVVPGMRSARSISSTSSSEERWSGQIAAQDRPPSATPGPRPSRSVPCGRHSDGGLSTTVVSIIEKGAGSVEVSARPALPKTRSTSGNEVRMRSWVWSRRLASVTEIPGRVVGM